MPLQLKEPGFLRRACPLSVEAWHEVIRQGLAPKRAELIRGVVVEKMSKSFHHVRILARLMELLQEQVDEGFWLRKEDPLTFRDSEPEPDISVVEGAVSSFQQHPTTARLVIEVSVSTLAEDREMAGVYAEAGVTDYWIVNVPDRCIEFFSEPKNGSYMVNGKMSSGNLSTSGGNLVSLEVKSVFEVLDV